jgi:phage terminase large subunit-like protein
LGRKDLYAEILDDNPYALFSQENFDAGRVEVTTGVLKSKSEVGFRFVRGQGAGNAQNFKVVLDEVVIAVDPSMSSNEKSDETGIIVMGTDRAGHLFVLEDASGIYSPNEWAKLVINLYMRFEADAIVAEVNQGGDLVENTIRTVEKEMGVGRVNYKKVRATKGKFSRAEPVGALEEQGRIHHVGEFPKLEDQLVMYSPGLSASPDRMDAYVWGAHHLVIQREKKGFFIF